MAPTSKSALQQCEKATAFGNRVSIRMLEFLSTVKHHPNGFEELAADFLEICRILWSIETGLTDSSRSNQKFPTDMLSELEKRFKTTFSDLQILEQWLGRFLEYERRGTVGKIQRGWRRMFADNDVDKMRESLAKTRDALRMSALVFQWSLGDARIDDSVSVGYTGLAAALDRLKRGRIEMAGLSRVTTNVTTNDTPPHQRHHGGYHVVEEPSLPPLPPQHSNPISAAPPVLEFEKPPSADFSPFDLRTNGLTAPVRSRDLGVQRHTSISTGTVSSNGKAQDANTIRSGRQDDMHLSSSTEGVTLIGDDEFYDPGPTKIVRIKSDPSSMPHWTPRNTIGSNSLSLKTALINAIKERNNTVVEDLLDRGVPPDTGPEQHVLKQAIVHHDSEAVRLLLLFGADVNAPDRNGITPLFAAVEESFLDGATMLLKYGASPDLKAGNESDSPLALSVLEDKYPFMRLLLTYGGNSGQSLASGDTLLIKAILTKRSKKVVDLLLDYGADANAKNRHGHSPLFEAINAGRSDLVLSLLDHNANANLPGPKHMLWPAIHHPACLKLVLGRGADFKKAPGIMEQAASTNNIDAIRILLKAGVDPNAKKDGVYTPLCTSIRDNLPDIFQLLVENGADVNLPASEYPAFKCVTHFRTEFLPPLAKAGADLHSPKGILEMAVQHNNVEALNWLLDAGVSPNDKAPKTGATPLTTAIRENRGDLVDLLIARGSDPNVRGQDWPICMAVKQPAILRRLLSVLAEPRAFKGVMEMAVVANQLESVKLLLAAGVSVEDRNGGVFSPLTTAIRERRKDIVRYLLEEANADPNAPGEHLPIVKSIRRMENGDTEILEMLLERGANPNKFYRGHNAVIQALENGNAEVLRLIADRCGVELDAKDENGVTVAELAASRGWEEGTNILFEGKKILNM